MKITYFKSLVIATLMGIALTGSAQALIVKGYIRNEDNQKTTAYYTLSNSYEMLQVGKCSSFKLKLGFNDCYTFTLSKRGYRSRTIIISTFGNNTKRSRISINVWLATFTASDIMEPELLAGKIYYDQRIQSYNYASCCGVQRPQQQSQSASRAKMHYVSK